MLLSATALTASAAAARADRVSVHYLLSGSLSVTDNEFAVPSDDGPEADVYLQIRPGILLTTEGARMMNELLAQVELLEYARHAGDPTYSAFGSWKGVFAPGPRTELTATADGAIGKVTSISASTPADSGVVEITPGGATTVEAADATETMRYEVTPELRITQTAYARWADTDDNASMPTTTSSVVGGVGMGLQRVFHHDTISLDLAGEFWRLERLAPPGDLEGNHLEHQLNPRATLTWIHDLNREWSFNLQAGVEYVNPIGTDPYATAGAEADQPSKLYPIGSAVVAYSDSWGRASLRVGRSVAPDLYIAQNSITDSAVATLSLPVAWLDANKHAHDPKLALVGTFGVDHSQLLDSDTGASIGNFWVGHADVGLLWARTQSQTFGLRYQFVYQRGNADGDATAVVDAVAPSFHMDTVFFTFAMRYPNDVLPRPLPVGQSFRADRSDTASPDAEQVVPEEAEPAGGP